MATDSSFGDSRSPGARAGWFVLAPRSEVARWVAVAGAVAALLLGGVALIASHEPGRYAEGISSGLLVRHHGFGDVLYVFRRNLLVLGIHLCACWIGAIVGRPHQPAPASWGRLAALNRPVPAWMARASLLYALCVTLLSVGVQAYALGRQLADLSVASHISRIHLLVLVLPHAVPELVAVFLPLGLFLLEARRGRLDRLGAWSLQAAAIALPVLLAAAVIEAYVTPPRVIAASHRATSARVTLTGAAAESRRASPPHIGRQSAPITAVVRGRRAGEGPRSS